MRHMGMTQNLREGLGLVAARRFTLQRVAAAGFVAFACS
jgi:hypothetical protein